MKIIKNVRARCDMPPSPDLFEQIVKTKAALEKLKSVNKSVTSYKKAKGTLSLDQYEAIISRPHKSHPETFVSHRPDAAPVLGVRRTVVLLVDFSDAPSTQSKAHFEQLLFSHGSLASGSMREFYKEASYDQLDVTGEVHGWFRAPQPKSFYTNNDFGFSSYPNNAQKLAEDVLDLANASVNFSSFDNSGDGKIEAVVIIAAGTGAEQSGNTSDIWSHKWNIIPKSVDGKTVDRYFMAPEDGKVGVMCHELGHLLLGWPDLYDTDSSSRGTGRWDLMAGGSWNGSGNTPAHPCAWCKIQAGWITPTVITSGPHQVTIPPYATNRVAYKLPVNGVASNKEYFLLSNRQKTNFDGQLPGEGLIIEHIDDNQSNNTNENHYLVDIEQADGDRHLNTNSNSGDTTDAYPIAGNNSFTNASTPSSKTYANADSKVSVTNISRSGQNITATLLVGSAGPTWQNNKAIKRVYTSAHSKNAYVALAGQSWKRIETKSADGVTAIFKTACSALANSKIVDVLADSTKIYRIVCK